MIKLSTLMEDVSDKLEQQKLEFRGQLRTALAKDGGLQNGDFGPEVTRVVDLWMEDPRTLLDGEDIEFIIDDETLFEEEDEE